MTCARPHRRVGVLCGLRPGVSGGDVRGRGTRCGARREGASGDGRLGVGAAAGAGPGAPRKKRSGDRTMMRERSALDDAAGGRPCAVRAQRTGGMESGCRGSPGAGARKAFQPPGRPDREGPAGLLYGGGLSRRCKQAWQWPASTRSPSPGSSARTWVRVGLRQRPRPSADPARPTEYAEPGPHDFERAVIHRGHPCWMPASPSAPSGTRRPVGARTG